MHETIRRGLICAAVLLAWTIPAWTQTAIISGKVIEQSHGKPLSGAHVWVIAADTGREKYIASTDSAGSFTMGGVKFNTYALNVTYLGYGTRSARLVVDRRFIDLGVISLSDSAIEFKERLVEERMIGTEIKGDTTEYNADAFETEPDATAEELVARLPGVDVDEDGDVKAQGEEVQEVLVDGQPFFGADPTVALRNLPTDAIAKVQVFDKLSDQAQLTGFDDGQSVKVLNIITRPERRRGVFGHATGGYGNDSRYNASTAMNFFDGSRRLSLIGLTNNVNQQNFSQQDLLGVLGDNPRSDRSSAGGMFGSGGRSGGRSGGGGPIVFSGGTNSFLVGELQGLTSAHSLGFNHSDSLWNGFAASTSYFFNLTDNHDPVDLSRRYGFLPDSILLYGQDENANLKNYNHRIYGRYDYAADSSDQFIFTPRFYIQNNHRSDVMHAIGSQSNGSPFAFAHSNYGLSTDGFSYRGNMVYRRRFSATGRTLSVDLGTAVNRRNSTRDLFAAVSYPPGSLGRPDSTNHESLVAARGYGLSANVVYTEPLGSRNLFDLSYTPSRTHGDVDDKAYDYDPVSGTYGIFNSKLSNTHEAIYTTQQAGAGWRFRSDIINATAGVSYQIADLNGGETFPNSVPIDKRFYNLLPEVLVNGDFPGHQAFRIQYRTFTTSPTITELQDLVNKRNLLHVTAGNPDLRQSYTHIFSARVTLADLHSGQHLFFHFLYNNTHDYIGDSSFTTTHDTVIRRGIHLSKGAEFVSPMNLDQYWDVRSSVSYGFPVDFIKSSMTVSFGLSTVSTPSVIRGLQNRSRVTTFSPGISLRSAASATFDVIATYTAHFNRAGNDVFSDLNTRYFSQKSGVRMHWYVLDKVVLRTDLNEVFNSGPSPTLRRNLTIWNLYAGYKLFGNRRGELTLGVHNLLNGKTSVTRLVDDSYIEDNESAVLQRYLLLTFRYSVR